MRPDLLWASVNLTKEQVYQHQVSRKDVAAMLTR